MNPDDLAAMATAADLRPELGGLAGFAGVLVRFVIFPSVQAARWKGQRVPKRWHTPLVGLILLALGSAFAAGAGQPFFPAASAALVGGFLGMALHNVQKPPRAERTRRSDP